MVDGDKIRFVRTVFGFRRFGSGGVGVAIDRFECFCCFDVLRGERVKESEKFDVQGTVPGWRYDVFCRGASCFFPTGEVCVSLKVISPCGQFLRMSCLV